MKVVYLRICDVGTLIKINVWVTVKPTALSCWVLENVPNKNCSLLTEKKTKSRSQNEPKNPPRKERKNNEGQNRKSEEKERKRSKKKATAALLVFMFSPRRIYGPREYNLGQSKFEQQTPIPPKSKMKPRKSQNAPFSHP